MREQGSGFKGGKRNPEPGRCGAPLLKDAVQHSQHQHVEQGQQRIDPRLLAEVHVYRRECYNQHRGQRGAAVEQAADQQIRGGEQQRAEQQRGRPHGQLTHPGERTRRSAAHNVKADGYS